MASRRKLWSRFSVAGILPSVPATTLGRDSKQDGATRRQSVGVMRACWCIATTILHICESAFLLLRVIHFLLLIISHKRPTNQNKSLNPKHKKKRKKLLRVCAAEHQTHRHKHARAYLRRTAAFATSPRGSQKAPKERNSSSVLVVDEKPKKRRR